MAVNWSALMNAPTVFLCRSMFDEGSSEASFQALHDYLTNLLPGEVVSLEYEIVNEQGVFDIEVLIRVLGGAQAHRIHQLALTHNGPQNITRLCTAIGSSSSLRALSLTANEMSPLDLICSIVENPSCQLFHLETDVSLQGDFTRLFDGLQRSTVKSLYLGEVKFPWHEPNSLKLFPALCKYLELDCLLTLDISVETNEQTVSVLNSLSQCRLIERLELHGGSKNLKINDDMDFNRLPQSIVRLELNSFKLPESADAAFYKFCIERSFPIIILGDMCINMHLVIALTACAEKNTRVLGLDGCEFDDESLRPLIVQLCQPNCLLEEFSLEDCQLTDDIGTDLFASICNASCKLKRLNIENNPQMVASLSNVLLSAIRNGECNLTKLQLGYNGNFVIWDDEEYMETVNLVSGAFALALRHKALLTLVSAAQVRRLSTKSALRRLPIEMFRLVGGIHIT